MQLVRRMLVGRTITVSPWTRFPTREN